MQQQHKFLIIRAIRFKHREREREREGERRSELHNVKEYMMPVVLQQSHPSCYFIRSPQLSGHHRLFIKMLNLINTDICAPASTGPGLCHLQFKLQTLFINIQVSENQQKASDLFLERCYQSVRGRQKKSSCGNWGGMGGALFSNFYFHIQTENKGQNKRKVPLELLGELAYLFSVL